MGKGVANGINQSKEWMIKLLSNIFLKQMYKLYSLWKEYDLCCFLVFGL